MEETNSGVVEIVRGTPLPADHQVKHDSNTERRVSAILSANSIDELFEKAFRGRKKKTTRNNSSMD